MKSKFLLGILEKLAGIKDIGVIKLMYYMHSVIVIFVTKVWNIEHDFSKNGRMFQKLRTIFINACYYSNNTYLIMISNHYISVVERI